MIPLSSSRQQAASLSHAEMSHQSLSQRFSFQIPLTQFLEIGPHPGNSRELRTGRKQETEKQDRKWVLQGAYLNPSNFSRVESWELGLNLSQPYGGLGRWDF